MIGKTLGPYKVLALLGRGGMGEVYRARDEKLGRDVALKMLAPEVSREPERIARFEREARTLASLQHPNVASLYGFEESEGDRFLVMELVEGEDLAARLGRGPLATDEALEVASQIARGLEAAHERGIVHRDLKPANVKIGQDDVVKILDFGLAREAVEGDPAEDPATSPTITSARTQAGAILGTAAYMSPEQIKGRPVDARADVWAFGVLLFEMWTGRRAFGGDTVPEILAETLTHDPDTGELPATVRRVVDLCLKKDPRERLRDVADARLLLENAFAMNVAADASRPESRRPSWWALLIALGIGVALTAIVLRPGDAPPVRTAKFDLVADDVELSWNLAPMLSPSGGEIAYTGQNALWVRRVEEIEPRRIADVEDVSSFFWSPDGEHIAYVDQRTLWRVPSAGGRPVEICSLPGTGEAIGGAWRHDGTIAFASWRGAMYVVSAEGGRPASFFDHDPDEIIDYHTPSWLPDGGLLYVVHVNPSVDGRAGRANTFAAIDYPAVHRDGEQTVLDVGGIDVLWIRYDPRSRHLLYSAGDGIFAVPFDMSALRITGEPFLVAPEATSISIASDGSLLYVESSQMEGTNELTWANREGRTTEVFTRPMPGLAWPAISPDGARVAFTSVIDGNNEIWIHDVEREVASRLTFTASVSEHFPLWTPDGRDLVYGSLQGILANVERVRADGTTGPQLLVPEIGSGSNDVIGQVAPDGSTLVYLRAENGRLRPHIVSLGSDGVEGDPRPLFDASFDADVMDVRISPDGTLMAYASKESGRPEVYLTRFPNGVGRWQVSTDGGKMPRWASETGELFYQAGSGPVQRALVSVRVNTTPQVSFDTPQTLFDLPWVDGPSQWSIGFDVTADGQRFALVRATTSRERPERMILVQNWFAEFAKRE